jgi:hypothetical protein
MLKVTPHELKNIRWWYEQHLEHKINMQPRYQRKADIWSKWKRAHLIDSLINDFDVPKFYVANFKTAVSQSLNEHNNIYAIIDGKQRFGAIFDFFNDKVALNQSCVLDDDPTIKLGNLRYSDIRARHPQVARKIEAFVPTVMNVVTDSEHKIEELFVRLNMGEATTGAERRNAMGGPVPIMVRELSQHPFFAKKIRFNVARMQEHNLVAKLLLFEFKDRFVDAKAKQLDDFTKEALKWMTEREATNEDPLVGPYSEARDRVHETLERLTSEFADRDPLLAKQGEIPIYYWIARQHPTWVNELRDFVLQFSDELMQNLRDQREGSRSIDQELSAYYAMSRTTNDQNSLEGRYAIFLERFKEFRRPRGRRRF